jgi:hypothetical protein
VDLFSHHHHPLSCCFHSAFVQNNNKSTDDYELDPASSGRKKNPRHYKNLPFELQDIDHNDVSSFICALELDSTTDKEQLRAPKMIKNSVEILLLKLNVDQLRLLCRRIGITGASSAKRDACRALIANLHTIHAAAKSRKDNPRSVEQTATNTLLCQINVIFSSEFVRSSLMLTPPSKLSWMMI